MVASSQLPTDEVRTSHPGMAISVAVEVARMRGLGIDEVLTACLKNTKEMYGI